MCRALGELGQAITAYAAGFDVDVLPPGDLAAAQAGALSRAQAALVADAVAANPGTARPWSARRATWAFSNWRRRAPGPRRPPWTWRPSAGR